MATPAAAASGAAGAGAKAATGAGPTASASVVVDKEHASAFDVSLHPLVIINMSDHYTRAKVSGKDANPRVVGVLLGIQSGRKIEIFNSFELTYNVVEGKIVLNADYLRQKQEQMRKVFPLYEVLGWYSTGSEATATDLEINAQILPVNESPLFLLLDPVPKPAARDLPLTLYENELRIVGDQAQVLFAKTSYKIETGEAERISVDHVARVTSAGAAEGSKLVAHLNGLLNAIKMLNIRVQILLQFLDWAKKNPGAADPALLRQIASLCNELPAIDTGKFRDEFLREYNDALLVTYLSSITKGCNAINEVVDKYNVTYDKHSRRSRFF